MKLTQVNKTLDSTVQATSRQLQRLYEARLIIKNVQGQYTLTQFGRMALALLQSFNFINDYKDYLETHDLSFLPDKFIHRLGQLSEHENLDNVDLALNRVGEIFFKAKKYFWCMADELGASLTHHSWKQNLEKIEYRLILPKSLSFSKATEARARSYLPNATLNWVFIDKPKMTITLNENQASIAFPLFNQGTDIRSWIAGKNSIFHQWCFDLYKYYWSQSEKSS